MEWKWKNGEIGFSSRQDYILIAHYLRQNVQIGARSERSYWYIETSYHLRLIFMCCCMPVITFNLRVFHLHMFLAYPPAQSVLSVTRRYSIPLVLLGSPRVCAVTQPDLPKPARLPSRLLASNRPRTGGCTLLWGLLTESWGRTNTQWQWSSFHSCLTLAWPKLSLLLK